MTTRVFGIGFSENIESFEHSIIPISTECLKGSELMGGDEGTRGRHVQV
jgi:hypothetical protein